jgi:hypothetical protein
MHAASGLKLKKMKEKNILAIAVLLLIAATATTAYAQSNTTVDTANADAGIPKRSISYGNTAVDYQDSYRVLGRRHDQMVMVGETDSTGYTPYYWSARTIDGFYLGGFAGADVDFGKSEVWQAYTPGYAVYATVGYTGKWVDLAVSGGYSRLANPYVANEKYGAWSAFFEPSVVVARWNKETEINRFYVGGLLGFQERKVASVTNYEDEYVSLLVDESGRSTGIAFGGKLGYEWRMYMGGLRIGVEARFHTDTTTYSAQTVVNGVTTQDDHSTDWRFQAQLGITMKGVLGRKANNYSSAMGN